MTFIEEIKQRVKSDKKRIVLPEAMDVRILKATEKVLQEDLCEIVLIGNKQEIKRKASQENINIDKAILIDNNTYSKLEEYASLLAEADSKISLEEAKELVKNPAYFGMMMVKAGDSDGYVSGAMNTTKDILKAAMRVFRKVGTKILSTVLVMIVPNEDNEKVFLFSDCALNENPGYLALSEIAMTSSKTYELFTKKQAKVAMLSYSTFGSAKSELTEKVIKATERVKAKAPKIIIDGEMQLDTAIVPEVAKAKAPNSKIQGDANVLIFPDINSGNIGCKLVERLAKAQLIGPICQGMEKPINDLSRGCDIDSIIGTILITAIQAQN